MSVKINLQNLPRKEVNNTLDNSDKKRIFKLNSSNFFEDGEIFENERIYSEYSNGQAINIYMPNYFIGTYLHAYNNHQDCIFNVNDIWAVISSMFSKYVNDNHEILRNKFVNHEGKKDLTIIEYANNIEESLIMEKKWDYFFEQIFNKIKENTNNNIVK